MNNTLNDILSVSPMRPLLTAVNVLSRKLSMTAQVRSVPSSLCGEGLFLRFAHSTPPALVTLYNSIDGNAHGAILGLPLPVTELLPPDYLPHLKDWVTEWNAANEHALFRYEKDGLLLAEVRFPLPVGDTDALIPYLQLGLKQIEVAQNALWRRILNPYYLLCS